MEERTSGTLWDQVQFFPPITLKCNVIQQIKKTVALCYVGTLFTTRLNYVKSNFKVLRLITSERSTIPGRVDQLTFIG